MIFQPADLPVSGTEELEITTLANRAMLNAEALQVARLTLAKGVSSDTYGPSEAERFVYVIRGSGRAQAGGQYFPLEAESVLWIDKGDAFSLQAYEDELEVLLCQAPASE